MKAYPLLGEVVGVVLQTSTTRSAILRQPQQDAVWKSKTTYNFHALSARRLRNGVLDEPVRGEGLQKDSAGK